MKNEAADILELNYWERRIMMKHSFLKLIFLTSVIGVVASFLSFPVHARNTASYTNDALNFSIEYPKSWADGQKYSPFSVLQVNDPSGSPDLGIAVSPINKNIDPDNSPEEWINAVKNIPGTDNFKIEYKKAIKLNDGTDAVKAKISWTLQGLDLVTSFITSDRNERRITVTSTGLANISFKVMEGIVDSFKFNELK